MARSPPLSLGLIQRNIMKGLSGKVAIVSGGSSGIGKATCQALIDRGVRVMIADINIDAAQKTVADLNGAGDVARFVKTDIANEDDVIHLMHACKAHFGRLDILVNCAALFIMKGLDATPDDWQKIMAVNVAGYALCVKHAVPLMREQGKGAIVNVSSMSGFIAQPNFWTYSASKGAVTNLTRCMALDLAGDNIRVNAVCPGSVWTQTIADFMGQHMGLDRDGADRHPEIGAAHMLKRCADPAEIAEAICFLASDSASFITAENLMVDGGYTAR